MMYEYKPTFREEIMSIIKWLLFMIFLMVASVYAIPAFLWLYVIFHNG